MSHASIFNQKNPPLRLFPRFKTEDLPTDPILQQKLIDEPNKYYKRKFGNTDLIVNKISIQNQILLPKREGFESTIPALPQIQKQKQRSSGLESTIPALSNKTIQNQRSSGFERKIPALSTKTFQKQNLEIYSRLRIKPKSILLKSDWRISIPNNILTLLVKWFHALTLYSTGPERLFNTIASKFDHPRLRVTCQEICMHCRIYKRMKKGQQQFGHLAPRDPPFVPWQEVHVDSIGPWPLKVGKHNMVFQAMTMIDPVTNIIEIGQRKTTRSQESVNILKRHWLSRYPRPIRIVHDNGPEFKRHFQEFLLKTQIKSSPTSPHSPTANSVIEHTHQGIAQIIRTYANLKPPKTAQEAKILVEQAFGAATYANRTLANINLGGLAPGEIAFRRDMHLDIPLIIDLHILRDIRQANIDYNLLNANNNRIRHDYKVNEHIYLLHNFSSSKKAKPIYIGPYPIVQVHTNNTVTIRTAPRTLDRVNIRNIKPAHHFTSRHT